MRTRALNVNRTELLHIGKVAEHVLEELGRSGPGLVGDQVLLTIATDLDAEQNLEIASILSSRTKRGRVNITIDALHTQLDVAKAKEVHRMLGEAIEAAISDECAYTWLRNNIGLSDEAATAALQDFRSIRQGAPGAVNPS